MDTTRNKHIVLIGASFNTGNLGVSALGWSSLHLLLDKWPQANIEILRSERSRGQNLIDVDGYQMQLDNWPIRFCYDPVTRDHFWKLLLGVIFVALLPFLRSGFAKQKSTLGVICRADLIVDITGGDSFSDIYGIKRFVLDYFTKRLCQMTGKPFVMLPQTYGPFKNPVTRLLASRVLKKTARIYSRDKEGIEVIKELIGRTDKLALCPDVAFILDAKMPDRSSVDNRQLWNLLFGQKKKKVIGLNVSGLLYNGGYTGNNEFGLKSPNRELIKKIIDHFSDLPDTNILLVPHVVSHRHEIENDLIACHQVRDDLSTHLQNKVFIAEPKDTNPFFDHCEIKYIIGKCDFFIGSRMHATIAAISQCVPTIGLAYSKKFAGVYETVGVSDCVIDLRNMDNHQVLDRVKKLFKKSENIKQTLIKNIPKAKQKVCKIFENL
jgi:colanic acid/amylovoran biosynthesis protein